MNRQWEKLRLLPGILACGVDRDVTETEAWRRRSKFVDEIKSLVWDMLG